MTLRQQIIDDVAAGGVFFPVDDDGAFTEFNTTVTFYPLSDKANKVEEVRAIVVQSELPGLEGRYGNQGDGLTVNDRQGRAVRESYDVYLPEDVAIADPPRADKPDVLLADGIWMQVKRVFARDWGLQRVHCVKLKDSFVRRLEERG